MHTQMYNIQRLLYACIDIFQYSSSSIPLLFSYFIHFHSINQILLALNYVKWLGYLNCRIFILFASFFTPPLFFLATLYRLSIAIYITVNKHIIIKLLEIVLLFCFIRRSMWDALLKSVRCEIISFKRNEQIDAYVLR